MHARTNTPLAGVSVRLVVWPPVRSRPGSIGTPLHQVDAATDADGRFQTRSPVAGDFVVQLFFEKPGFCLRRSRWRGLGGDAVETLPNVALVPGAIVRGVVQCDDGTPLPEGHLLVAAEGVGVSGNEAEPPGHAVEPDASGVFRLTGLPPGAHQLIPSFRGWACRDRVEVSVTEGLAPLDVRVVLERLPTIAGHVVDRAGQPVPRATVDIAVPPQLDLQHRAALSSRAESLPDGSFALMAALGIKVPAVHLLAWAHGYREGRTGSPIAWGSKDVRIVLDPAIRLRVRALERATRAPVEDYRVRIWRADRAVDDVACAPRLGGRHAGGVLDIPHLSAAGYWLSVEAPGHAASLPTLLTVSDAGNEAEVLLDRSAGVTVQLLDAAARSVPDAVLEIMLGPREQVFHVTSTFADMLRNPGLTARLRVLATATTDQEGRAAFADLPPCVFHVRCRNPKRPFALAGPFEVAAGEQRTLEVRLPAASRLEARIVPESLVSRLAGVQLVSASEPKLAVPMLAPMAVATDGSVVFDPVPQGAWRPRLLCRVRDHATGSEVVVPYELESLTLDTPRFAGAIDAAGLLPTDLRCRVLVGERAAEGGLRCHLVGTHGGRRWTSAAATLDSEGRAEFASLAPGRYELTLSGAGEKLRGEETITVPVRGDADIAFHLVGSAR